MNISTRTPEGMPNRCPICGNDVAIVPSIPPGDAPCPHCGSLLWFAAGRSSILGSLIAEVDSVAFREMNADLWAANKKDALRILVDSLVEAGEITEADERRHRRALLRREELGSTAIGHGVAIPHAKHPAIDRMLGVVARSREGIDFGSIDGKPVHRLVLLLSPRDRPGDHLPRWRGFHNCCERLDLFCATAHRGCARSGYHRLNRL